ncbi:MAG: hypothetical protein K2W96_12500 [Gemmataceae bacterium]|nr:hypothetical protein [Gemmataceae bacterium]
MTWREARLAGLILGWIGLATLGVTSPYAWRLSSEHLRDPARPESLRRWDRLGERLGFYGTMLVSIITFLLVNVVTYDWLVRRPGMFGHWPHLLILAHPVLYWAVFLVWWLRRPPK